MTDVYSKTTKGLEEIKTRAGGLSQRARQTLIFIDGKRSAEVLFGMLKHDDLKENLALLVEQGYADVSTIVEVAPPPPPPVPESLPPLDVATDQLSQSEKELKAQKKKDAELEAKRERAMAHNFMSKM